MTDSPPLFEEMLAAYPADKREMARRVYDRFANGDATEFFAQLFLLLDVYANYAKRIPQAVSETNQSTLVSLKKVREEIGLLAQTVERRSLEMGNAAEDTSTLCLETQEKAEAAAKRLEKLTQDIASKVDTESIVESIRTSINAGIRAEVTRPQNRRAVGSQHRFCSIYRTVLPLRCHWPSVWLAVLTMARIAALSGAASRGQISTTRDRSRPSLP